MDSWERFSTEELLEIWGETALKGVVGTGLGFAIMSRVTVERERRLGELVALPLQPKLIRTLSLVYPKEKFRSKLVNKFVDFAKSKLKDIQT